MSANFTPTVEPYHYSGSFKFWCQKVLPLVYDDSLSYYELLCKVIDYLNNLIHNVDGLKIDINNIVLAFNELQNYVNHYFDNLDVQNEINNKLDQMVDDGTLANIINVEILGDVQGKIDNIYPRLSEHEEYIKAVRQNIVSYLIRAYDSPNIKTGIPLTGLNMVYRYKIGSCYMGLYGAGTFNYTDTENINGVNCHVAYLDCSNLTSLITKCINFDNSPYYYAFTDDPVDIKKLYNAGLENSSPNASYSFDGLNNLKTDNFARIMDKSGNRLQLLKSLPGGVLDETVFNKLETGDLIFIGRDYPTNFLGIYHCGVFVKTLEELDDYAKQYNITFKTHDNQTSEHGYIFECWNETTEAVVLNSFDYWLNNIVIGNQQTIYMCKSYSNALNSNKAHAMISGLYRVYDDTRYVDGSTYNTITIREGDMSFNNNNYSNFIGGQPKPLRNINIDEMYLPKHNGLWKTYSTSDLKTITGTLPFSNSFYFLEVLGGSSNGRGCMQRITIITQSYNSRQIQFERQTGPSSNVFGEWHIRPYDVMSGTISNISIPAHSRYTQEVALGKTLPYLCRPVASLYWNGVDVDFEKLQIAVFNNQPDKFTINIYNNSDNTTVVGVIWVAV